MESNSSVSAASQLIAIEVISELLVSTSPRELAKVLTDHLRELTGAKTAMVLVHQPEPHSCELLHASPSRRASLIPLEAFDLFCPGKAPADLPYFPDDLPAQHPLVTVLERAGVQSMVRFPLKVGGELFGLLLLFDLPGIERFTETTQIINLLAPPMALALKNALAFFQIERQALELERRVEERTEELRKKNLELSQSEERFRRATDEAPFPIMIHASDGEVLALSRAWIELSGYAHSDILTIAAWTEKAYGIHKEPVIEEINTLYHLKERKAEGEFAITCRDGSTRIWDFSSVSLGRLPDGRLTAMSMASDVTQRKLAEESLSRSEYRNRSILQTTMEGFWLVDADRYILETNDAYCLMSGYSKEELQGMHITSLEAIDTDADTLARAKKIIEEGGVRFESQHRRKDGTLFFVEVSIRYLPIDEGRFSVFIHDITERKLAEEGFREARALLQAAMDCSPAGIAIADAPDGKLRYVNDAGLVMRGGDRQVGVTGFGMDQYVVNWRFFDLDESPLPTDQVPLARAIMFGETNSRELIIQSFENVDRVVWANAAPIRDDFGAVKAAIVVFTDISEHHKAEAERAKLQSQLQQAQKIESVGRLAGGVAHDFNNMLSVILGHAELALMHLDKDHRVRTDLMEIILTAQRSAELTRQLLAFARKQTVSPKVLDLNVTVSEMIKMLRRLIGEDILLDWRPAPDIWQVRMDPSQIDQILANLCVNARDAIYGNGYITIETTNVTVDAKYCAANLEAKEGEYVCLSVSDSGSGMDKETQTHIFEPFYTTKELGKGTGLGLATVYGAVKQNSGFINVYSEKGQGTTFSIYLPRDESVRNAEGVNKSDMMAAPRGRETILLVEDEPAILQVTATMLESQGYTVLKAASPGEAVRIAREHSGEIQLLMTDVIMPEMNGRTLAKNLLSIYPNMKRLFMSGYTADVIAHRGILEEGVHFIQKPFSIPEMAAKVREVIDSN